MAEQQQEHYLKEAPYVVMDAGKKGYGAQCVCGWRSALFDTEAELQTVIHEHLANPPEPVKRRFWQRKNKNPYGGAYNRRN
jgi:hypothetical protein